MKYEMEKPIALMRASLYVFLAKKPLQMYVIACRLRLEMEAKSAAKFWQAACPKVYSEPTTRSSGAFPDWGKTAAAASYLPEMTDISAGAYFRLLRFVRDGKDSNFVDADPRDKDKGPASTTAPVLHPLNFEDADIVLRSSDGVDFRVHKLIISLISSNLLDNGPTLHGDLPIFDISENGRTLATLLDLCYPNSDLDAVTSEPQDLCTAVLTAAHKYKCSRAVSLVKRHIMKDVKKNPLRVYFTATRFGWEAEVREAALCAASKPIEGVYVPEMEFVCADVYNRLLKYCHDLRSLVANVSCHYWNMEFSCLLLDEKLRSNDTPQWWYLDYRDAGNLPVWIAAPVAEQSRVPQMISESRALASMIEARLSTIKLETDFDQPRFVPSHSGLNERTRESTSF